MKIRYEQKKIVKPFGSISPGDVFINPLKNTPSMKIIGVSQSAVDLADGKTFSLYQDTDVELIPDTELVVK